MSGTPLAKLALSITQPKRFRLKIQSLVFASILLVGSLPAHAIFGKKGLNLGGVQIIPGTGGRGPIPGVPIPLPIPPIIPHRLPDLDDPTGAKKTKKAREEAQAADNEAAKAQTDADQQTIEAQKADEELKAFSNAFAAAKGELRNRITPINARLFTLRATADAMAKSHKELLDNSKSIHEGLETLGKALATVGEPNQASLMNEQDRALVRVLQIALGRQMSSNAEYKEHLDNSMQLVSHNGRGNEKKLRANFLALQKASANGPVGSQVETMHAELNRLTDEILLTQDALQNLTQKVRELDGRTKE